MDTISAKPVLDRLIIKQDEGNTHAGILEIAETSRVRPKRGEVVAVGPGAIGHDGNRIPLMVKVGDKVTYGEYSGAEVNINGEKYIVVKEGELLFVE